jgi:hypothetical protein
MKVQDVMTEEVHTCRPDTNLAMAAMAPALRISSSHREVLLLKAEQK